MGKVPCELHTLIPLIKNSRKESSQLFTNKKIPLVINFKCTCYCQAVQQQGHAVSGTEMVRQNSKIFFLC